LRNFVPLDKTKVDWTTVKEIAITVTAIVGSVTAIVGLIEMIENKRKTKDHEKEEHSDD